MFTTKFFFFFFQFSVKGGWSVILWPHDVVYSLKFNLRAESIKDFAPSILETPAKCVFMILLGVWQLMSTYVGQLWYLSIHMKGDWLHRHQRTSQQLSRKKWRAPYHGWLKCCRILMKMAIRALVTQTPVSSLTNSMRPIPKTHRKCWGGLLRKLVNHRYKT